MLTEWLHYWFAILFYAGCKCLRSVFRYLSQSIKQYQYYIFSWSVKIWAPIFVHPKAVTDLKRGLYSPSELNKNTAAKNSAMFSTNFCRSKLWVCRHLEYVPLRIEIYNWSYTFLSLSRWQNFPQDSALLTRECSGTDRSIF